MLVEGMSIRATSRVAGVSSNTVMKLVVDAGRVCDAYHNENVRGVEAKRIQCDEIWAFCYAKDRNLPTAKSAPEDAGSIWTWTAIDRDTKMILSWLVSPERDAEAAQAFMIDLRERVVGRPQIITDGLESYTEAAIAAFEGKVDYAQLIKDFQSSKYMPGNSVSVSKKVRCGEVRRQDISTSYIERHNLTMRMCMRRFTRKTNAFSKKIENHCHATALFITWYNFGREHSSLSRHKVPGVTPSMEAGLTTEPLTLEQVARMIENPSESN